MTTRLRARARAETWLAEDPDPITAAELRALLAAADRDELAARRDLDERFTGQLEFGTAGLRGVLGAGPQRMNRVLIRKVTAGLAAYLLEHVATARTAGVVVGRDARTNSQIFAEDTARVLAGAGIKVYLAHRGWPTPTTAWSVTALGACAAVMVTASHNPAVYNGYKVYWGNGAQIIPPHDSGIAAAIAHAEARGPSTALPMPELAVARAAGMIVDLDEAHHDRYIAAVVGLRVRRDADATAITVAYTAMHGIGAISTEAALARAGFPHVHSEPAQREPDPTFPTVAFPNPEEAGAMDRVLALATSVHADVVLANDPDADRLCVAVPEGTGYRVLTGDQVGALLADYLLANSIADRRAVATTIVSSQLLGYLARQAGADYRETLTGFKWIANAALELERTTGARFVMGYEEALGYSVGALVRDKDGVSAALMFAELAAVDRAAGRSVLEHLDDIYRRVGVFVTAQVSLTRPGSDGLAQIKAAMTRCRTQPPAALAGQPVTDVVDLLHGDLLHGADRLPPSDVLIFRLAGGRRVIMRPSGTEPKLKSYYEVRAEVAAGEPIATARARAQAELAALRDAHQALLA